MLDGSQNRNHFDDPPPRKTRPTELCLFWSRKRLVVLRGTLLQVSFFMESQGWLQRLGLKTGLLHTIVTSKVGQNLLKAANVTPVWKTKGARPFFDCKGLQETPSERKETLGTDSG